MKILKSLALVAGLAFITANVSAQAAATQGGNKPDPQKMAQQQTDRIKQNVTGITPAQESQILAAEQDYSKSMQDAWSSSNGDKEAMKSKMEPVKAARDAKLKTILTADQYTQYQNMHPGHRQGAN